MGADKEHVMCPANGVHHWIIETPTGPVSKGRCKYCGEVRDFNNLLPDKLDFKITPASTERCIDAAYR